MQEWKARYNPVLAGLILVAFCAALWLVQLRYQIERQSDTVEQALDYQAVLMMAQREGTEGAALARRFKEAGVTTMVVYDATLERLDREGRLAAVPGDVLRKESAGTRGGVFDVLLSGYRIDPDTVYIARGSDAESWEETREDLLLRYGSERVFLVSRSPEILAVKGDTRVLLDPDYRTKTPVMQAPLGLSSRELKEVKDAGFLVAVRPQNYLPYSRRAVDSLFARIEKSGAQVTTYLPCGSDVISFPEDIGYMAGKLSEKNIRLGLFEHTTQLRFAAFDGLDTLLRGVENNAVRVLNIDALENSKLTMPEALHRWALADEERNIRFNYVRLFLKPQNGVDIIDLNLDYMEKITRSVQERGYKIGTASVFQPPGADTNAFKGGNPAFGGDYFPNRGLLLLTALGAWAALALYLELLLPSCRGRGQYILLFLGACASAFALFAGRGLLLRQGLSFLSAVLYPVLSLSVILMLWEKIKTETKPLAGIIVAALWQLALAVLLSLVGATLNAAILGDTRFFLEADIYRGVKLTFIMPVLLTLLLFVRRYDVFASASAVPASLFEQFRRTCKIRLTLGHMVVLGALLFVAYYFVGRSGHTGGVPVPDIEIRLRVFLEQIMYARPREKEFMIGHPAFCLAVLAVYRRAPLLCRMFLVTGAVIGQGSLVQTFCHMRTPAFMSYIRALDGYAVGAVLGIIAVVLAAIIVPRLQPWLRRFSIDE